MRGTDEYFGTPDQIRLMKRSRALWQLLKDNPRFSYYGRLVGLSDPAADTADVLHRLAMLQGATCCYFYPAGSADKLFADLESRGLVADRHEHFWGGADAYDLSRTLLDESALPDDLTVGIVDDRTSTALVSEIAALSRACEVMPVPGHIMRGNDTNGLCLYACDRDGRVVATASSYVNHHPDGPHAKDVFWGMLATREDRRGERIALNLGAKAIVHMWEVHGARHFMTGVRANNPSSQALCLKLGVGPSAWIYASCMDAEQFAGGAITR